MKDKKIQLPSVLANFAGDRRQRGQVRVAASKPPKRRFKIGDAFMYDGEPMILIYMYRIKNEPHVWYHALETVDPRNIDILIRDLGAGATTPRIVYDAFMNHDDAKDYFRDIGVLGWFRCVKSTQNLLKLKRYEPK